MSNKIYVTVGVDNRTLPSGGDKDQVLTKASNDDYDLKWADPSGGGSGGLSPYGSRPYPDITGGSTGQSNDYARGDHRHELNVDDTIAPEMNGVAADAGTDGHYSRADHVHQHDEYRDGFKLYATANVFDSVNALPAFGNAGRIAFVKISNS